MNAMIGNTREYERDGFLGGLDRSMVISPNICIHKKRKNKMQGKSQWKIISTERSNEN